MKHISGILAASILVGCAGILPTTQHGVTLVLTPQVYSGKLLTQAVVSPYTSASIDHLTIRLYEGATELANKTLLQAQLNNPITFSNLRNNTSYRIKSYAYLSSNTLISKDDASSWLDFTTGTDDRPFLLPLPVQLIDIPFNGQGTGSVSVTSGGYGNVGPEKMGFLLSGVISLVAGVGSSSFYGDGGPATAAAFSGPFNLTFDSTGNLYISDHGNHRIRKLNVTTGIISTIAGNGSAAYAGDGGPATAASLYNPRMIAFGPDGNLYITDKGNNCVRKVNSTTGIISTVAGNGSASFSGDGGPATAAAMTLPLGLAFDSSGNMYITDYGNNRIRKVDKSTGIISTYAGVGTPTFAGDGGPATAASLNAPRGINFDPDGNLYIADVSNYRVRKVNMATGIISTVVGSGGTGFSGDGGQATAATLINSSDVAFDMMGNLFLSDQNRIRKVDKLSGIITTIAGNGSTTYNGDGPATACTLAGSGDMVFDSMGNLYFADIGHNRIRMIR